MEADVRGYPLILLGWVCSRRNDGTLATPNTYQHGCIGENRRQEITTSLWATSVVGFLKSNYLRDLPELPSLHSERASSGVTSAHGAALLLLAPSLQVNESAVVWTHRGGCGAHNSVASFLLAL